MNKNIILKIGFLLLLIAGESTKMDAQSQGFVEVFVRLKHLHSTEGMRYYPPWGPPSYPYLKYWIDKIEIKDANGDIVGASVNKDWYYPNQPSETKHNPNEVLISNVRYSNSFGQQFDLSSYNSLTISYAKFQARNELGYTYGYFKYPFTEYFSSWAFTGNQVQNKIISIQGTTTSGITIPYPYHFTMEAKYNIDAIERDILIATEAGATENEFCERQRIRVTVPYKSNFKNGTFEFQRKYPGEGWVTIASNHKSNVIYDYAKKSGTRYRARLQPSGSSFGVTDYTSTSYVATSKVNIIVNPQIDDFNYSINNVCEGETNGKITINGITGATNGGTYVVSLLKPDGTSLASHFVNGYTSDYFTATDVSFDAPVGQYSLAILHSVTKCGILKKYIFMRQSIEPVYSSVVINPKCHGELGVIQFIKSGSGNSPGLKTFRAISTTSGDTISLTEYYQATLNVPPGSYMLSVENSDGCLYELSEIATIIENPDLTATITPSLIMEANGVEYHMCTDGLADLHIEIAGGVPPYQVKRIVAFPFNYSSINLLPNQTSITFPSVDARTYNYQVIDNLGCTVPLSIELKEVPRPNFPELIYQKPTHDCGVLTSNGSITQNGTASGGIPPYDLFFSQQQVMTFDSINLSNSGFLLGIVDSLGCRTRKLSDTFNDSFLGLDDDGEFYDSIVPCGGSIQLNMVARGGSVATGYSFFTNGVECALDPNCNLSYFNNVGVTFGGYEIMIDTGKVYHFEVMDDLGCSVSSTKIFYQPQIPEVTGLSIVPPNCMNGIYETTFYISDPNIIYSNTINYVLDGVAGTAPLKNDGTPGGLPIKPYEFTISVTGDSTRKITITDELGCGATTPYEFTLEPLSPFTMSVDSLQHSFCSYDTAGVINFSMTGNEPYQVELFRDGNRVDSISVVADKHTFTNLLDGNYTIDITDRKGCNAVENNIILTIPDTLKANVSSTSLINCTGNNGEIQVTNVTGGTPPYRYALNGQAFQTDPNLQNALDSNTIEVRDANNCILSLFLEIPLAGEILFPTITQTVDVAECELGTAVIELLSGFTFPISIQEIENPNTFLSTDVLPTSDSLATVVYRDTLKNLTLGKHYYFIKDGLGCEKIDSVEMTAAVPLIANISTKTAEACYQQSGDGTITVSASGGQAPYTITLLGDTSVVTNDSTTFSGLAHGYYDFAITDSRGCSYGLSDSIISGSLPLLTFATTNYLGCVGTDLTADVTLTGYNGVAPYSFEWENGSMDNPRLSVAPGQYLVTVTDGNGCTNQDALIVLSLDSLEINIKTTTDVVCQADSTGQISVTTKGAFPPYQFSIDDGNSFQMDSTFTNLPIGDYEIIVKNAHDCLDTTSATITFTNALQANVLTTNETCATSDDGTLKVTVSGGIAPFTYSLNNVDFQFQNEFTGLAAGTYTAWVLDGSGCKAVYDNNTITEPAILNLATNLVADEACSQMNGSASGSASGGTPPYVYEWDGNASLNNVLLENAAAGVHTLKVTDANMCTQTSMITIEFLAAPIVTLENSQSEICGNANGLIDLKITNGTAPFSFQWNHDGTLNDSLATNLPAGNYAVTVSDANSCTDILSVTINEIAAPSLSLENSQSEICGNANGQIDLQLQNGTAPYTFQWSHDGMLNDSLATNLTAGNYAVTVTDANACTDILSTTINEIAGPTLSVLSKSNSICTDDNGEIILALANGTAPFTYTWAHNPTLNNNTLTNLSAGTYSATVTDANGCQAIISTSIIFEEPTILIAATPTEAVCFGANGSIQLAVSGGAMPPYTYSWSHDGTLNNSLATDLLAGSYDVTVSDALGCFAVLNNIVVTNNTAVPTLSIAAVTDTDCSNPVGNITVQVAGGSAPFTYAWSHDGTLNNEMANNLTAGNYTVTVTDANGCEDNIAATLGSIAPPTLSLENSQPEICGNANGSIDIKITNGVAPFIFAWSHDGSLNDSLATNLAAGDYMVTVTDANLCTDILNVSITEIAAPSLSLENSQSEICGNANGQIDLKIENGIAPFTFAWSHDGTLNDSLATNLAAGNYSVTVTDANACTDILSIEINETPGPTLAVFFKTNSTCTDDNGAIVLQVANGTAPFIYTWPHDNLLTNNSATNLAGGSYQVMVKDANDCRDTLTITIDFENTPTVSLENSQAEICGNANGSIDLKIENGVAPFTFAWSHDGSLNDSLATNLAAGDYSATVIDANGCTYSLTTTVDFINGPTVSLENSESEKCGMSNGSIDLKIENGVAPFTFVWSHDGSLNDSLATNLAAGNYTVTVSDANACTDILDISIDEIAGPSLNLENSQAEICGMSNGQIDVEIENGTAPFTFQWSHDGTLNDSLATGLAAGNYTVTISDANACTNILSATINEIVGPTLSVFSKTNSICTDDNGEIILETANGTAPYTYTWAHDTNLNNNTLTSLPAGTYAATVTDANGCPAIISTSINFDQPVVLIAPTVTAATCLEANGRIQLAVTGGALQPYTYSWSQDMNLNNALATDLAAGNYSVTVSDALGCSKILNDIVVENAAAPILSIAFFNNTDCLNPMGDITVQVTDGLAPFTFEWSHDSNVTEETAMGLTSGNYSITVTDANGCKSIVTQALIEFEGEISITNTLQCSADSVGSLLVTLQGNPTDYNYAWSEATLSNSHIVTNLANGTYTVTVTNSNGCTQDFSVDLFAPDEILPNISNVIPVGCAGNLGSATAVPIGGTGNYTYSWNDPNGQTTPTAVDLPIGNYTVLITDENNCTATESIEIIQSSAIVLTQGTIVNPLCIGDANGSAEAIATGGFPPYEYLWSDGQTTPVATNLASGDYTVFILDAVGCVQNMTITVTDPMAMSATGILVQEPFCFEGNEGEATVSVSGGTTPYQFQWDDNLLQTTDTATNLLAGNYNVTITDVNGCSTTTEVDVTQPTALQINNYFLQIPSCVESADGSIEVDVEGGTPDYEYSWNGGVATNNNTFTNIDNGVYTLEVIDNKGCSISDNIVLADPDSILVVNEILIPVSCEGTGNGSIEILAEGGDQNISYAWANGTSGNTLENLPVGNYEVSITDGLGCETITSFEVESIDVAPLDLGSADTLICNNGVLYYDFSNTDYVEFSWGNVTEGELSNAADFTTVGEDIYYLKALRNDGCLVEDSIQVRYTGANLDAFFIAPTDIVVGDTIIALELTLPIPDGVSWEYDTDNIELVEQRDNQYLFHFTGVGEYDLKMTSSLGGCQSDISKTIFVYADSTQIPFFNATVPIIANLNLFPNPNDGIFTIDVELANVNDMVIDIFNEQSMLVDRNIFTGKDKYSQDYQLDLPTGIYYVIVQVAGARRSLTFVIK